MTTGEVVLPCGAKLGHGSPPIVLVVFARGDILGLWVLPVELEGGCFGRPKV